MSNIKCSGQLEAGTNLKLGNNTGIANSPHIDFHTDGLSTTAYNSRISASENSINIEASQGLKLNGHLLLDLIHPVGSVYISTNDKNPKEVFHGGEWEQIAQGRALFGEGNCPAYEGGPNINYPLEQLINAGIPNIKATMENKRSFMGENTSEVITTGAFSHDLKPGTLNNLSWGGTNRCCELNFNAQNCSPVYSDNCQTVQPNAFVVKIWKRIS